MSKNKDLAAALTDKHGLSKQDAEKFVSAMFDLLNSALSTEKLVKVKGLGTFKVISVAPRKSVDVNTGEPIVIEGRDKISFTPDASLRDEVNKPFAQFDTVVVNDGVDFSEIDKKFSEEQKEADSKQEAQPVIEEKPEPEPEPVVEEKVESDSEPVAEKKTESEPVVDDKSEPVIDEKVEPVAEEKIESKQEAEPEPVVEDNNIEPEQKLEPVIEKEKEVVEKQDAAIEEVQEEVQSEHNKLKYVIAACFAVIVICLAGGFYMFSQLQKRDNRIANLEAQLLTHSKKTLNNAKVAKAVPVTSSQQEPVLTNEIINASADNQPAAKAQVTKEPTKKNLKAEKPEKTAKAVEKPKQTERKEEKTDVVSSKYDSDPRVRTGAYNIIGVDKTVTVKAGQTLTSISRSNFGPGMECYVEAVNGGKTEFKVGDKIKLPKLQHKKKK